MPNSIPWSSVLRRPWQLAAVAGGLLVSAAMVMSASAATLDITTTTADLHDGAVGQVYASETLVAVGGTPPYTWSVEGGDSSLPGGLTLSSAGVISGTPTTLGNTTFTVRVIDSASNMATETLTIKVNSAVVVQTTALPSVMVGTAYPSTQLVATGGTGTYTWTLVAGALPTGFPALATTGVITGTATAAGTYNFTVRATDAAGHSDDQALSILVTASGTLTITTASLPNGVQNAAYSQTLAAAGGSGTGYLWALEAGSSLPAGLSLSAAGVISGTPSATGTTTFTVRVTDSASGFTTKQFTINVLAPIDITTGNTLPAATAGAAYSTVLAASGGTPPYTWSATPPAGLAMSASTGAITGTPTTAGTSTFAVQVTDFHGFMKSEDFTLTVNAAGTLNITTTTLPNALANASYTQQLQKTGGSGTFTWSIIAGSLPLGLTLDPATGLISGTAPATLGTSTFTVQVLGNVSGSDTQQLSITVASTVVPVVDGDDEHKGNLHGLCNAFFSGSEQGRKQKAKATAFLRLIEAAGASGDWDAVQDKVRDFCEGQQNNVLNVRHHDDEDDDDDDKHGLRHQQRHDHDDGDDDQHEIKSSSNSGKGSPNLSKSRGKSGRGNDG